MSWYSKKNNLIESLYVFKKTSCDEPGDRLKEYVMTAKTIARIMDYPFDKVMLEAGNKQIKGVKDDKIVYLPDHVSLPSIEEAINSADTILFCGDTGLEKMGFRIKGVTWRFHKSRNPFRKRIGVKMYGDSFYNDRNTRMYNELVDNLESDYFIEKKVRDLP